MQGITAEIQERIIEKPAFLDMNAKYVAVAGALNVMEATKCIVFAEEEAKREFGKCFKQNLLVQLKKCGIKKPRIAIHKGRVHIYKVDV